MKSFSASLILGMPLAAYGFGNVGKLDGADMAKCDYTEADSVFKLLGDFSCADNMVDALDDDNNHAMETDQTKTTFYCNKADGTHNGIFAGGNGMTSYAAICPKTCLTNPDCGQPKTDNHELINDAFATTEGCKSDTAQGMCGVALVWWLCPETCGPFPGEKEYLAIQAATVAREAEKPVAEKPAAEKQPTREECVEGCGECAECLPCLAGLCDAAMNEACELCNTCEPCADYVYDACNAGLDDCTECIPCLDQEYYENSQGGCSVCDECQYLEPCLKGCGHAHSWCVVKEDCVNSPATCPENCNHFERCMVVMALFV